MPSDSAAQVEHVFVLMLENHSFDNLLAWSGIPDLRRASPDDANDYQDVRYEVGTAGAPVAMPVDPGHEVLDVAEQLCGDAVELLPWRPYPSEIDMSGFVSNFATSTSEPNPRLPEPSEYRDVMACFDTAKQLPVLYALASNFTVCDMWFSSVPGSTFPNRFFVHGASSNGWADTPSAEVLNNWLTSGEKFTYPSGSSIFDRLTAAGQSWCVYRHDMGDDQIGSIPWVAIIEGVNLLDVKKFSTFKDDLAGPYPYAYTFIEPYYGHLTATPPTFAAGSSQHPRDGMAGGETLIKATYEAIRNSSLWDRSLLVVLYDEHGGFYDSIRPGTAPPPADGSAMNPYINQWGLLFDHYGPRVPAIAISPWLAAGVDHRVYDHATVPKTIETLFRLPWLTERDHQASDLVHLLTGPLRTDCPTRLPDPVPDPPRPQSAAADSSDEVLPPSHNIYAPLAVLALADLQASSGSVEAHAVRDRFAAIQTRGDASAYAQEVTERLAAGPAGG